jgi:uncharacterized membrane protein YgdD (TMEM256/DUF423 family)
MNSGPPSPFWWTVGCCSGAAAIGLGAFGAHALGPTLEPKLLKTWETAASYHLVHSVVILAASQSGSNVSAALLSVGLGLFSGSLYSLVLTGNRKLGAITPIGGLLLIAGWLALIPWMRHSRHTAE